MTENPRESTFIWTLRILRALALLAILGFGTAAAIYNWVDKEQLVQSLHTLKGTPNSWAVFAFVFTILSCLALPVTPLMLAAGCLFGFSLGALFNWIGACIASWSAYAVARWLGADTLEHLFKRPIERFREAGFRTTLFLRLIYFFPFAGVNFGAGAARVPFRDFILATAIGMVPSSITFTLIASSGLDSLQEPNAQHLGIFLVSVFLLVLGALLPIYYRRSVRKQRRERRGSPPQAQDPRTGASDENAVSDEEVNETPHRV